jgi:hypothetical protein
MLEHLRTGYASLANFVSHDEAEIIKRFESLLQMAPELTGPRDPRVLDIAKEAADGRFLDIIRRSNDEFTRLFQEFDAEVTA